MNPRVKTVKPNPDFTLTLVFTNGEIKSFDVKPYLDKGFFQELRDLDLFNSVKTFLGSVQWKHGQDFCPDTLYLNGVSLPESKTIRLEGLAKKGSQTAEHARFTASQHGRKQVSKET